VSSLRILLVDDHDAVRNGVRALLSSNGNWTICGEAKDGVEATEKAILLRPDVILMDISMPRMDGLQATRIIRRDLPACDVIIVTQNDASIATRQAAEVGASGFLTKSQLPEDLIPALEKLSHRRNSEAAQQCQQGTTAQLNELMPGGGELGELIRQFDWSKTPLGAMEAWPQSLKTVVRVLLTSRFSMWIGWGPDLTFLYNDAYARMTLGKKHPWALGKPSREVWAEIWEDIGPRIQKVLDSGEATWDEALLLFLERSGYREETYHTFSYSPLPGDDGKIAGHLCVVSEETERVIGERRLKTLRSLATELSKTITEEDVRQAVTRCLGENQKDLPFTLTYVFSADGKFAQLACRTGIPEDHPASPEIIESAAKNQAWPVGGLLKRKGSMIVENLVERFDSLPTGAWDKPPARALLVPIMSQGQEIPAGVIVAGINPYRPLDVTYSGFIDLIAGQIAASIANARAHESEKKRAAALAEIDAAKTTFFSNVSHEFRTPLTLMLGPLQDLLSRSQTHLSPQAKEQLELANRNGARLLRLVNTLLDFSRIEAGRVQAVYQTTDLATFTAELASVFRSATERAGLKLVVDCRPTNELTYIDRDMWEKIVLNLVSNAFKFTFEGEIEVSLNQVGHTAELRVRDTGVGVPPQEIPRLFDRFHRVPNTRSRTHEGSGIGLALVHELVKLHAGSMQVESTLGQGTTFVVSVPLGEDHIAPDRVGGDRAMSSTATGAAPFVEEALGWLPESERVTNAAEIITDYDLMTVPSPPVPRDGSGSRSRVLVADDNADMRLYLSRLLSERYDVKAVPNGQTALDAIKEQLPDLVLSDVMMPELDGFGLLRELRANAETKTIPIILLSARAGEESRVEGLDSGADDFLVKPFSARELIARVQSHLQLARVRSEANLAIRRLAESLESEVNARTRELEQRNSEVLEQAETLQTLSRSLMHLQDDERRHIARELHDSAGQTLTVLGMKLAALSQLTKQRDASFAKQISEIEEIGEIVQQLTKEIRTTSYLLHPPLLDETGIADALKWYVDGLAGRSDLNIALRLPEDLPRFSRDTELVAFRVVQECLTNIHRHSGSKNAVIDLSFSDGIISVKVSDNGKGIPFEKLSEIQSNASGVGIRGMRERVRQLGGRISIASDSSGTTVSFTLPASVLVPKHHANLRPLEVTASHPSSAPTHKPENVQTAD
jgi:signal transduction histidine kinase